MKPLKRCGRSAFIQFISLTKFLPLVFTYSPEIQRESKFGKFIAFRKGNYNHFIFLYQQKWLKKIV